LLLLRDTNFAAWYDPSRQRFSLCGTPPRERVVLEDDSKTLLSYGVTEGSVLEFKDLGPQIGWRTVFVVEYAGALFIYGLFAIQPASVYGIRTTSLTWLQWLILACWLCHYFKREIETVFVHRFGSETMPLFNIFKNCAHYWFAALIIGYLVNRPGYGEQLHTTRMGLVVGLLLFLVGEIGNAVAHVQLRNLRRPGTKDRRIPRGALFMLVSCPNYTFEAMAWIGFSILSQCWASWAFFLFGFVQMTLWARKKHQRYIREFGDSYPRNRSAIIPFIL